MWHNRGCLKGGDRAGAGGRILAPTVRPAGPGWKPSHLAPAFNISLFRSFPGARRAHHERWEVGGIAEPLVDGQVRSAGRAAQPGTSARRFGTGRTGARTACRRPRAGAATSACTAAGAAAAAVSFSEALARRSGTAGRAHTSLAGQEQRHRCRDRARSRARRSGRGLGSVRRQHLEPRRDRAARHTSAARETAGDCHERTRRSDDGEVI